MKKQVRIKSVPKGKTAVISPFPNFSMYTPGHIETNNTGTDSQKVTDSVKPVDRDKATIEAEAGEVLIQPGLEGIYKIKGNPHSKGGTPLHVEPGSFIVSDDTSLAFSKSDKELFDFKKGSSNRKSDNTPAKVLMREVNPKEYNTYMTILQDPQKDSIAKRTAEIMLQKYQEKIGQVALLQEAKKGAPDGLPEFAAAPPMPTEQIENKLAMFRRGGTVLPKAQKGGYNSYGDVFDDDWRFRTENMPGTVLSNEALAGNTKVAMVQPKRKSGQYGEMDWDMNDFANRHSWYLQNNPNFNPANKADVTDFQKQYNARARTLFGNEYFGGPAYRAIDGKFGEYTFNAPSLNRDRTPIPTNNGTGLNWAPPVPQARQNVTDREKPAGEIPWQGFNLPWTDLEKLSAAAPFLQAVSMKSFYDPLWLKYTPNERLDRVDNSAELNTLASQSALAQREASGNLSGVQSYLGAGQVRAAELDGVSRSEQNKNNVNTQIANQEALINRQAKMADNDWNIKEIADTYDRNVLTQQRRQEMLQNGVAQSFNNAMEIEHNIESLEQMATATALPYLSYQKDANGNPVYQYDKNGNRYRVQGVPFGFTDRRMPAFVPGFGDLNSLGVQMAGAGMSGDLTALRKKYMEAVEAGDTEMANAISRGYYSFGRDNSQQAAQQNPWMRFIPQPRLPNGY